VAGFGKHGENLTDDGWQRCLHNVYVMYSTSLALVVIFIMRLFTTSSFLRKKAVLGLKNKKSLAEAKHKKKNEKKLV